MSNIALQVERQAGGSVAANSNVVFDTVNYSAGNVMYNAATGLITFPEAGRYVFNWWIATQSSVSAIGSVFALASSQGDLLKNTSAVKSGEVSGGGIIDVVLAPVTVSLINASNAVFFYGAVVPTRAMLTVVQDDIAGETGPTGPIGETGPTGPTGETGPSAPLSFVQLFDRNYANELTANAPLNLSNEGINPLYTSGGYSLTTTSVTNDTLNLPGAGLYHIELSLRASFLLPLSPPPFGSTYQIIFNVLNESSIAINNLAFNGIIPNDPNAVLDNQLNIQFLYNTASLSPSLSVVLSSFDFSLAFDNQLSVFDIILIVEKWPNP